MAAQIAERKVFVQGVDKQGRALVIVSVKDHIMAKRDMIELERFVCFCIDALVSSEVLPSHQQCVGWHSSTKTNLSLHSTQQAPFEVHLMDSQL